MKNIGNVLSLFDGMSCGHIALKELGISVGKYYASEIDKHAIRQTQHNFPDTIQLGDVTKVHAKDLERIDLLIGGSPCQGFSFAGKQLNFNDPRSALFFEFVRLWKEIKAINPNAIFLLENVNMAKDYLRVISEYMGVFPVRINSNLVSAQNRDRWYWTNIRTKDVGLFDELWSDIPQPEDKGMLLTDILEDEVAEKYYLSDKMLDYFRRNTERMKANGNGFKFEPTNGNCKSKTVTTKEGGRMDDNFIVAMRGHGERTRRLTPTECARLQTIPDWYEWIVSDTQQYRMLGNGWTVDVVAHIFSFIQ